MSLINDALKRAKAAQQKEQPQTASPLQFRPVDSGQKPGRPFPWLVIFCVGATAVIAAALLISSSTREPALKVEAKAAKPATNAPDDKATELAGSNILPPAPKPTTIQPKTQAVAVAVAPAPTEPAKLRLQGIVYHPTRPSAMINGKAVFVGDKVAEFKVRSITRDSATLVSGTETNVLTFEQ